MYVHAEPDAFLPGWTRIRAPLWQSKWPANPQFQHVVLGGGFSDRLRLRRALQRVGIHRGSEITTTEP